jgi:hypothetical protein
MANELKVKNGLIVVGNISSSAIISGSQISASGFFGTSSWAANAVAAQTATTATTSATASYATYLTGSATASLFGTARWSSFSISASWAPGSGQSGTTLFTGSTYPITASWAQTASVLLGLTLDNSSSLSLVTASNIIVIQRITGSYVAAFFDYAVISASNMRAGTVFGGWIPGSANVSYTEISNVDVGDTSQVSMSLFLTQSFIQLLSNAATSYSWSVKAIGRYI